MTTPSSLSGHAARRALTPREIEVLGLVAQGRMNQEIVVELFIAERTASNHVSNIPAKLCCGNRVEAAAFAYRHGLAKTRYAAPG